MATRPLSCAVCGASLTPAPSGRPRRYCSGTCRKRAFVARTTNSNGIASESGGSFGHGAVIVVPEASAGSIRKGEAVVSVENFLDGETDAPAEAQAIRWLIEAQALEFSARRLGQEAPPQLAWRFSDAGRRISTLLRELFNVSQEEAK